MGDFFVPYKQRFQSTPPARGATPAPERQRDAVAISIHAPREGGDSHARDGRTAVLDFNPRPPRGGRPTRQPPWRRPRVFQSTPPARGATRKTQQRKTWLSISIHAPREGGDMFLRRGPRFYFDFNPRPPRGGRPDVFFQATGPDAFQSTPPARGATPRSPCGTPRPHISIHAPREGGDQ